MKEQTLQHLKLWSCNVLLHTKALTLIVFNGNSTAIVKSARAMEKGRMHNNPL